MAGESRFTLFGQPTPGQVRQGIGRTTLSDALSVAGTPNLGTAVGFMIPQVLGSLFGGRSQEELRAKNYQDAVDEVFSQGIPTSSGSKYFTTLAESLQRRGLRTEAVQAARLAQEAATDENTLGARVSREQRLQQVSDRKKAAADRESRTKKYIEVIEQLPDNATPEELQDIWDKVTGDDPTIPAEFPGMAAVGAKISAEAGAKDWNKIKHKLVQHELDLDKLRLRREADVEKQQLKREHQEQLKRVQEEIDLAKLDRRFDLVETLVKNKGEMQRQHKLELQAQKAKDREKLENLKATNKAKAKKTSTKKGTSVLDAKRFSARFEDRLSAVNVGGEQVNLVKAFKREGQHKVVLSMLGDAAESIQEMVRGTPYDNLTDITEALVRELVKVADIDTTRLDEATVDREALTEAINNLRNKISRLIDESS